MVHDWIRVPIRGFAGDGDWGIAVERDRSGNTFRQFLARLRTVGDRRRRAHIDLRRAAGRLLHAPTQRVMPNVTSATWSPEVFTPCN